MLVPVVDHVRARAEERAQAELERSSQRVTERKKERDRREALEVARLLEDEGEPVAAGAATVAVDDEDGLGELTAAPFNDDALLYALPFCAPYAAMQKFKFKVKLTPGKQKRGKASKTCVSVFTQPPSCTPIQRDLMKNMTDNEIAAAMIGDVKITAPGLAQAAARAKRAKKKQAKKKGVAKNNRGTGGGKKQQQKKRNPKKR